MIFKLVQEGYKIHVVARPLRDRKTDDYIHGLREKTNIKTIFSYPRKECISRVIRVLRNKEIVMIHMDQNFGTGGVWVRFFNKLAATPVGPIVFALRTNAPVVPMNIIRRSRGKHSIEIFPEVELDRKKNRDETILVNAAKFTKLIESWVKEYPSHWEWIHRRWKSRPSEKIRKAKFKIQLY